MFAAVATQLAALGHVLGGGAIPDPAMLLRSPSSSAVRCPGSPRAARTRRRSSVLAASQLLFHVAFALTAHHASVTAMEPLVAGAARMVAFHLFAALAASWLMAGGESTLFRLFAALHRVLVAAASPAGGQAAPAVDRRDHRRGGWTLLRAGLSSLRSRRGPPLRG